MKTGDGKEKEALSLSLLLTLSTSRGISRHTDRKKEKNRK
jgi:hypothetical protein